MFYVLDDLDYATIYSISYLWWKNPNYFFDVDGDYNQLLLHMEYCDRNFEIRKVIDDATTIEVKAESYTLSTTKDFIHALAIMLVSYYVLTLSSRRPPSWKG